MGVMNEREEFEKAAIKAGHDPVWDGDQYLYEDVQTAWEVWQARAKHSADLTQLAKSKIDQMGGTVCGVLVRNEAGALAAVHDLGRVTWLDGADSGEAKVNALLGLSAFEVKALAQELARTAHESSDGDDDYPLDVLILAGVKNDDDSITKGPILCVRDSDYPEEGVCPILNSQEVRDRYTKPPANQVPDHIRALLSAIDEHLANEPDPQDGGSVDASTLRSSIKHVLSAQRDAGAGQWIPCSERLPTEADEDERHDLWTCLKDVNGKMQVARNNAAFVEMFAQQRDATKFWWMPTGLRKPQPPEQESE